MPPVLALPGIISEATKRRLEQSYHPNQSHGAMHELAVAEALNHILPASSGHANFRNLPSITVSDDNFDDAYVSFIMYCNPSVPLDTDTTELKKVFRSPPKSDGKMFSTFTLFELIRRLEEKELKTWAQLAVELGVERPDFDKGQSSQKVQQYSVRLKRWMHAMHVDAFFEYLMSKPHVYWTQIPSLNDPKLAFGRDGVSAEEDLALRALLPETRPKRGRRKAEDRETEEDAGRTPTQRRRLESPTFSEENMSSRNGGGSFMSENASAPAHPGSYHQGFDDRIAPWSAMESHDGSMSDAFRWPNPNEAQTPMSAYPRSAITPSTTTQMWNDGSQSAITPNKSRQRRRHGPGVSSAWAGNTVSGTGKLRGRPPTNRSSTDGPFSTFPANPEGRDVPTINLQEDPPTETPSKANSSVPHFFPPSISKPANATGQGNRPSKLGLQLQVPQREGGAVRLATPPPVVLLNGGGSNNGQSTNTLNSGNRSPRTATPSIHTAPVAHMISQPQITPQTSNPNNQNFTPMLGYFTTPSTGDQDTSFSQFVSVAFRQNEDTDRTNVDALEAHFISEILSAEWFDGNGMTIDRCSIDEAAKICKQIIKNIQTSSSSTETFLINLSALAGGPLTMRLRMTRTRVAGRSDYECQWKMRFGSIEGDCTVRASVDSVDEDLVVGIEKGAMDDEPEGAEGWKKKFLDLQQEIRLRDQRVDTLKRGVINALIVSNHWGKA